MTFVYDIDALIKSCSRCNNKEKINLLNKAYKFLINNLTDKNIINHSLEVASIIGNEVGLGATSISAALLHELPRYSEISLEDIKNYFGIEIFQILDGLYKIKNTELIFKENDIDNIELYRQVIFNMSRDLRIIYLRIAERLVSLRHFDQLNSILKKNIPSETLKIYAPIAEVLGNFKIKSELEDKALKYINPQAYNNISKFLETSKYNQWYLLNKVALPIINSLYKKNIKFTMQSRQKSIYSIYKKIQKKNIPIDQVYDIFAIRIILYTENLDKDQKIEQEKILCEQTFQIIKNLFEIHPNRVRDWLSKPKQPSGYIAKHVTVKEPKSNKWVEIQIRGEAMNEIAEFGYASHWKYKGVKFELEQFSNQLKQVTKFIEDFDQDVDKILSALDTFFSFDKIHVYTPDFDEITLNKGATVFDFAAKVHTDLLRYFGGAIINNSKTVSGTYELNNGDIVKIINTNNTLVPKKEWINKVTTYNAKKELLKLLNIKNLKQKGFEILLEIANKNNITIDSKIIKTLLKKFSISNKDELYKNIATGDIPPSEIKTTLSKFKKSNFFGIIITNSPTYKNLKNNFTLATCCNPTPNDKILAIKQNNIYHIHKINCSQLQQILEKNSDKSLIPIEWQKFKAQALLKKIKIKATYRMDYLLQLTKVLYTIPKVEIHKIEFSKDDKSNYIGSLELLALNDFDILINKIKEINGTLKVEIV